MSLEGPIAIVGNATSAAAWGAVIDRYATVVRLNNFRLDGFERLVGSRVDVRCTSAWYDIEHREGLVEISPFTAGARESENLATFNQVNEWPVLAARTDVRPLIAETPNPSTGLTLAQLVDTLGLDADLFCFDGFRTPHYWRADRHGTSHAGVEFSALLSRPRLAVMTATVDYASAFAERRAELATRRAAAARAPWLRELRATRVLEVAAWPGPLLSDVHVETVMVTASSADGAESGSGGVLALAFLEDPYDAVVVLDLLHELHPNDARIVVRQSARLAPRLLFTIPGDAVSRAAESPIADLLAFCASRFDVTTEPVDGGLLVRAIRRDEPAGPFHLRAGYAARDVPAYFPDLDDGVVWQPDVYRLLADLGREMGCRRVIDLGCGRARKLADLHPGFDIVGVDVGSNLEYCREHHSFGLWLEADFEQPGSLAGLAGASESSAIVSSDVIEHLTDPSGLMATLAALLEAAPFAILTTPERELTHGADHTGPPPNPSHVREWNARELAAYARSTGLDVAFVGLTASHSLSFEPQTTLLLLAGRLLPASDRERLVATCQALLERYASIRAAADAPAPSR